MINLEEITRAFIVPAIKVTKLDIDSPAIKAVHNKDELSKVDRSSDLKTWFRLMAVFHLVKLTLEFADRQGCHYDSLSYDGLIENFRCLRGECSKAVRPTRKGAERDLRSLASKALWCCYPNTVPIYDRYAQNALWVICKFAQIEPHDAATGYEAFADVWLKIYKQVEPIIATEARRIKYPYKVRVFDRVLWIIGQPYYSVNGALARLF